ncbi:MAG TPA: hypothetical protein VHL09_09220 [Dehalococcoidia bacterium]|nr:hypothetical protein [Dehalococcoidia bacterium]
MLRDYVVDAAQVPWKSSQTEGITFRCQVLLSGSDGGPEALRLQFDPCLSVYAHMHLTSQFQVLLGGVMDMPRGSLTMRPVAVHYTDHNVPYGPFAVTEGHDMLVLHPKQGGLVSMASPTARRQIHLGGRLLTGLDAEREWLPLPGYDGCRCKLLIPRVSGPEALIVECPPDTQLALEAPVYGRYEVVLKGSVLVGGQSLGPPGFRYVQGDETTLSMVSGPAGATLLYLTFDQDALEGGLTGEGIAVDAAEALASAI